jgi:hypothetical protein
MTGKDNFNVRTEMDLLEKKREKCEQAAKTEILHLSQVLGLNTNKYLEESLRKWITLEIAIAQINRKKAHLVKKYGVDHLLLKLLTEK